MAAKVTAPPSPAAVRAKRTDDIKAKGTRRSPAERDELIDLLVTEVADLRARLDDRRSTAWLEGRQG